MEDEGGAHQHGGGPRPHDLPEGSSPPPYEPPRVSVLGTLAELTGGTGAALTDALGPGSIAG